MNWVHTFEKLSKVSIIILCFPGTGVCGFSLQLRLFLPVSPSYTLAAKILLSFMFELKQMEAIDSDEFTGNNFFECQRTMHMSTEFN